MKRQDTSISHSPQSTTRVFVTCFPVCLYNIVRAAIERQFIRSPDYAVTGIKGCRDNNRTGVAWYFENEWSSYVTTVTFSANTSHANDAFLVIADARCSSSINVRDRYVHFLLHRSQSKIVSVELVDVVRFDTYGSLRVVPKYDGDICTPKITRAIRNNLRDVLFRSRTLRAATHHAIAK